MTEIIKRFGSTHFDKLYQKYVETTHDNELDKFYDEKKFQPVLGGNDFRESIFAYIKLHSLSSEIVGADRILIPPSMEAILNEVCLYFNVDLHHITNCRIKNPSRQIAIFLCRNSGGYSLHEIGKFMGNVSIKTISSTLHRVKLNSSLMKVAQNIAFSIQKKLKFINEAKP